jgi:hypothetical protein
MILIVTASSDSTACHVMRKLEERGADVIRFDPAQFPSHASISVSYGKAGELRAKLSTEDAEVDLHLLDALWHRRPQCPVPSEQITDTSMRDYVQAECTNYLNDVWNSLDCLRVPASPAVIQRAALKASQLKAAGALGFELPDTVFTNSPDRFLELYRRHNGELVSKLPGSALYAHFSTTVARYTRTVSKRDVGYAQAVQLCPMIFQAYVPKRVELRITVVGETVFAAEIHSQVSNHTRHDWRHYDFANTPHLPHNLPRNIEERCVQLVKCLGLCYGAIDMVLTPDGRYVFLEINPNGQYLWIENLTGLPISGAICALLTSGARGHRSRQHNFELCCGGAR